LEQQEGHRLIALDRGDVQGGSERPLLVRVGAAVQELADGIEITGRDGVMERCGGRLMGEHHEGGGSERALERFPHVDPPTGSLLARIFHSTRAAAEQRP
ncbi:MAG TPA: hypothetical protein VFG43_11825, partial [Geminicoccaceae bacterium]|nr:hypothetical protein [Geminicoccaceae bacterium]